MNCVEGKRFCETGRELSTNCKFEREKREICAVLSLQKPYFTKWAPNGNRIPTIRNDRFLFFSFLVGEEDSGVTTVRDAGEREREREKAAEGGEREM